MTGAAASSGAPGAPPALGLVLAGLAGGCASGLLGIGGGLIVVPILAAWFGVELKRAIGTSLVVVLATAAIAVATEGFVAPANLRWVDAGLLATGACIGAVVGTRIMVRTPARILARLMAVVLVAAAVRLSGLLDLLLDGALAVDAVARPPMLVAALLPLVGVVSGIIAVMFGIGGGLVAVPALTVLHPEWPFQACRATSLVMIIPTSLVGVILHRRLAHVDVGLVRWLVPGALVGGVAGVALANEMPGRALEIAFSALLIASAIQLVLRSSRESPPNVPIVAR